MRRTLFVLLLPMSFSVLWGCAEPKSSASTGTQPAVESAKPQNPGPSKAVAAKAATPKVKPAIARNESSDVKPPEMKVANKLDQNAQLSSKVKPLLPPRTSVTDAAAGFKNQRQFIAAMHMSKNLGISFDQIKTRMTGAHRMSLTDSLRDIRPDMSKNLAKVEAKKAEEQAKDDEKQAKEDAKRAGL